VSRAGYNSAGRSFARARAACSFPIPRCRIRSRARARRIAELGLATVAPGRVDAIAAAMEEALARPPAPSRLDLGGVAGTGAIVEKIGAAGGR